jgi:hypothetical protein
MIKIKTIRAKPLSLSPSKSRPLRSRTLLQPKMMPQKKKQSEHPQSSFGSATTLPDAGNQPDPTKSDIERLQRKNKLINPIVQESLKDHPQDVLHGSRSLNMLLPNFSRKPHDWDLFSPTEKKRALQLEKKIDEKAGCDIAQTQYRHIPKMPFSQPIPGSGEHLYRVVTPQIKGDPDIDIMDRPSDLETTRKHGITHESLIEAHHKATTRRLRQPMQTSKASSDVNDIEEYWKKRGRIVKK